jgi:hypothetical protein
MGHIHCRNSRELQHQMLRNATYKASSQKHTIIAGSLHSCSTASSKDIRRICDTVNLLRHEPPTCSSVTELSDYETNVL